MVKTVPQILKALSCNPIGANRATTFETKNERFFTITVTSDKHFIVPKSGSRVWLALLNNSTASIYVGFSKLVSSANYFMQLKQDDAIIFDSDMQYNGEVWATTDNSSLTATLSVGEVT